MRTLDLTEANCLLRQEVEEHERTRDELIQAAKLAALGQMSAGINHELNQPLAADMVQLEQVLVNLIGNACDALIDAGEKRIVVSAQCDADRVRVQVHDSSSGIASDDLAHIFDPFFTTSDSGLGLGLSISHTIAQRLGGSLTTGNAADGGAVFTLSLLAWRDRY